MHDKSFEFNEKMINRYRFPSFYCHFLDLSIDLTLNDILHLHGFNNYKFLSISNYVPFLDTHRDNCPWHWWNYALFEINLFRSWHILFEIELTFIIHCCVDLISLEVEIVVEVVIIVQVLHYLFLSILIESQQTIL